MTTPSSSPFFLLLPIPWCCIKAYICHVWCSSSKGQSKAQKDGWKIFPAVPLTNLSSVLRLCASHASRVAATSKVSFTMNTEGDVFYVYVKRQFVSTVISADECLWIFLEVLCCLGARCMIKAICKAKCVTLMRNRCPRDPRNIKLKGHTDGGKYVQTPHIHYCF